MPQALLGTVGLGADLEFRGSGVHGFGCFQARDCRKYNVDGPSAAQVGFSRGEGSHGYMVVSTRLVLVRPACPPFSSRIPFAVMTSRKPNLCCPEVAKSNPRKATQVITRLHHISPVIVVDISRASGYAYLGHDSKPQAISQGDCSSSTPATLTSTQAQVLRQRFRFWGPN